MPPVAMFRARHRLSGLEFASCEKCNHATRAADAAASFFARISPEHSPPTLELEEARKLQGTLLQLAPDLMHEVFNAEKVAPIWAKGRGSIYTEMRRLTLDGPVTHALMTAFTSKLGMALFREHIGRAMRLGGAVFAQHYFNAGLQREEAKRIRNIMPLVGELRQGRHGSGRQFNYRYNCDDKSIIALFAAFHDNLFVRAVAVDDPDPYRSIFPDADNCVSFGGLSDLARTWEPERND